MSEKKYILKKEEAYTFHELNFIKTACNSENSEALVKSPEKDKKLNILEQLCNSVAQEASSCAVFFMPETTYNLFSAFQGQNAICMVDVTDVEFWFSAVKNISDAKSAEWKKHLQSKISVLLNHLKNGNLVVPVVIQADNLLLFDC